MKSAAPEQAGMSSARLQRLRQWQERLVSDERVAMTQVMISRRGRLVHDRCTGSQGNGRPAAPDSIYRIYSMTKPIVSVALMTLYEEGRFQLTDPLHLYLGPAWQKRRMAVFVPGSYKGKGEYQTQPCKRSITIQMLLTHTSGLSYGFDPSGLVNQLDRVYADAGLLAGFGQPRPGGNPLKDWVERLAAQPLQFQPGSHWTYGYNTDVVGRLVEVISGRPLDQFLRERIFGPLRMPDTAFCVPHEKRDRFCRLYARKGVSPGMLRTGGGGGADRGLEDHTDKGRLGTRYSVTEGAFFSGGGGLVGTARDYMRFALMLANGGELDGAMVLSRSTLQFMTANHLRVRGAPVDMSAMLHRTSYAEVASEGSGFGLGFAVLQDPQRARLIGTPGTFSWGGAASTFFWVDPAEELTVVFMTQHLYRDDLKMPLRKELSQLVYGALQSDGPLRLLAPGQGALPQPRL